MRIKRTIAIAGIMSAALGTTMALATPAHAVPTSHEYSSSIDVLPTSDTFDDFELEVELEFELEGLDD